MAAPQLVVVCGGGVIGSAVAYYLAVKHGTKPIVVEAVAPACSASGKAGGWRRRRKSRCHLWPAVDHPLCLYPAGGFLALDWCDSSPVGPLARRSFALHAQLAAELGCDTGYRRVRTHSISVKQGQAGSNVGGAGAGAAADAAKRLPGLPGWVARDNIGQASVIGTEEDTAQVHPELLTKALLRRMEEGGGSLQIAAVTGVVAEGGRVTAVKVRDSGSGEERELQADAVVFAMGECAE